MIQVTMASWNGEDGKAKYERFQEEVLERTAEPPWNNNDALMLNMSVSVLGLDLQFHLEPKSLKLSLLCEHS